MKEDKRPDTRAKARLRWFLDFLYLEIDSLPRADFFKLITELGIITLNPLWLTMGSREVPWIDRKSERQEIRGYQQHLKVVLENILQYCELSPLIVDYWKRAKKTSGVHKLTKRGPKRDIQDTIKRLKKEGTLNDYLKIWESEWSELQGLLKRREEIGSINLPFTIKVAGDRVSLSPTQDKDAVTAEFVKSLSPFSLNDIRRCEREDCGRYFLRATKKEKHYCSNKCAWVMASRKRRAENSEKEKQKKRLSYERRKKRELGPNVKVQRRKKRED